MLTVALYVVSTLIVQSCHVDLLQGWPKGDRQTGKEMNGSKMQGWMKGDRETDRETNRQMEREIDR